MPSTSRPGYLVYARDATLMAQRFDVATLSLVGEADAGRGLCEPSTPPARQRRLAPRPTVPCWRTVRPSIAAGRVAWFDRSGRQGRRSALNGPTPRFDSRRTRSRRRSSSPIPTAATAISGCSISRAAVSRALTTNPANDWQVAWAPDSRQIAFASDRNGPSSVYRKAIDAVDEELLLRIPGRGAFPKDWSARWPIAHTRDRQRDGTGGHLGALARRRSHAVSLGRSGVRENDARLSHDGRLIAFESDESGATEIYVAPFGKTGRRRVSTGGGTQPRWKADGRESSSRP